MLMKKFTWAGNEPPLEVSKKEGDAVASALFSLDAIISPAWGFIFWRGSEYGSASCTFLESAEGFAGE